MAKDKALSLFYDWERVFVDLCGDECKTLILAMIAYARDGIEPPEYEEIGLRMASNFIFPAIDRGKAISRERAAAGRAGGIAKAGKTQQNVANDSKTQQSVATRLIQDKTYTYTRQDAPPYPPTGGLGESARDELFEKFWMEYPKKAKRTEAEEAWKALAPDDALLERMLGTIRAQCASSDWQREGGRYIPLASNWLRDCRWEDMPPSRFSGYPVTYEEIESL